MSVGFTFFHFSPLYRMSEAGLEALIQAAQFLEENGGETRLSFSDRCYYLSCLWFAICF